MRTALIAFLLATTAYAQRPNSCADPYWKETLRCAAFPGQVPQPNRNDVPKRPQDIQQFTGIWLDSDPTLRCTDGTAPHIYVDKAVCTKPAGCGVGIKLGDPIESNLWLFGFHGGESCQGSRCLTFYAEPDERVNMGTATTPPMRPPEGIYSGDPVLNPVFAAYNRVKMEKCTFDRYLGRATQSFVQTAPNGAQVPLKLYFHGFRIIEAAFATFQNGIRYPTWTTAADVGKRRSCCGGESAGKIVQTEESLPPLANAETVLLVGHSNACHGIFHNADHLSALLNAIPGFHGDVRVFFDENFMPVPEGEAAFSMTAPANSDAYDQIDKGTTAARGESFTYDLQNHFTTDNTVVEYTAHGIVYDTSCMAAHAKDGKDWKCHDRHHVLFNHVTTPFVIREDLGDPNRDHLDQPNGNEARWGEEKHFSWCPDANPCSARFNATEFAARVTKQTRTLLDFIATRSELARGLDTSGPVPTVFAWNPNCAEHVGAYGDDGFYDTKIAMNGSTVSLAQYVAQFLGAPRTGVRVGRTDGVGGAKTVQCQ